MSLEWSVFFIVHAVDKDTVQHADSLFRDLLATEKNDKVSILVLYNAYQQIEGRKRISAVLWRIAYDQEKKTKIKEFVHDFGQINIGNDGKLRAILKKMKENSPAKKNILFTWDHGCGFGIFGDRPESKGFDRGIGSESLESNIDNTDTDFEVVTNKESHDLSIAIRENNFFINKSIEEESDSREFAGVRDRILREATTDMLTANELKEAIKAAFGTKKIDVLIMMNCWMQMIETGYALKECVEILVAGETVFPFKGYDYLKIINSLNDEIKKEDVAKISVQSLKEKYENRKLGKKIVVSAVLLDHNQRLKELIDDLSKTLLADLENQLKIIREARKNCLELSKEWLESGFPFQLIDFLNYIGSLYKKNLIPMNLLNKLDQANNSYIHSIYVGKEYQSTGGVSAFAKGNGCSIYHPLSKDDLTEFHDFFYTKNGDFEAAFSRDSRWRFFLEQYLI